MNQLIWNLDRLIMSRVSSTLSSLVKIVSAVTPNVVVKYTCLLLLFLFSYFLTLLVIEIDIESGLKFYPTFDFIWGVNRTNESKDKGKNNIVDFKFVLHF